MDLTKIIDLFLNFPFNEVTLGILSVGTIIFILDASGMLPNFVAKWVHRNRLETTIRAFKKLGVRIAWEGDKGQAPSFFSRAHFKITGKELEYVSQLKHMLNQHTLSVGVNVGQRNSFSMDSFIDVIGNSTDPSIAQKYAQILNTHLSRNQLLDFDFVATPKDGSPILGYEFAKLSQKPLVLGVCNKASTSGGDKNIHLILDYPHSLSLTGKKGILIDDSTTGGRKMLDLAKELRKVGATINTAAVLFEPQGKGARGLLKQENIELKSIITGPKGRN